MAERRGQGTPGVNVVVGMGDSVPAGTACGCTTYVDLLAQALRQRGMGTRAVNDAQPGATSTELLRFVTSHQVRAAPDQVTVITIGANDFDATRVADQDCSAEAALACYGPALLSAPDNLAKTLSLLRSGPAMSGPIVVTGYWNVFLDGAVGRELGARAVRTSDALTRALNARLRAVCQSAGVAYVDLYGPFHQGGDDTALLADDGDHPSAAGHALIAQLLGQVV